MAFSRDCKFCGATGLHWETVLGKWKLYDSADRPHVCRPIKTEKKLGDHTIDIKNDPKINKALKEFKARLDREGKKVYVLKKR